MSDHTQTYVELLRELDRARFERERRKLEAMTDEERKRYLEELCLNEMVNLP